MRNREFTGLAGRKRRNASLRAIGEEPAPGWDAGVKRSARFIKRWWLGMEITRERKLLYLHAHARRRGLAAEKAVLLAHGDIG